MNPLNSPSKILPFFAKSIQYFSIVFCLRCSLLYGENSKNLSQTIKEYSRREGYLIAEDAKYRNNWIDIDSLIEGMQDYKSGMKRKEEEISDDTFYMIAFELFELESRKNLQKATEFLHQLSNDATIHSLEKGKILYKILSEGTSGSTSITAGSSPVLHYSISTLDGQKIVDTKKRDNGPFQVSLSETILGFSKGMEGMRLGEKRKIFIHPDLGYGLFGQVPPNSLLIVDVEVIKI